MPSRPGIAMSSSSTSGWSASVRLIAESPSLAVPTSCAPSARARSSCKRSAASGSSSAIRTLRERASAILFHGQSKRDLVAAAGHRPEPATCSSTEAGVEPLTDVCQAKSGALVRRRGKLVLAAVLQAIADFQDHAVIVQMAGLYTDHHGLAAFRDAI